MGITREKEMSQNYILNVMKFLNENFTNNTPCVTKAAIKKAIVEDEDGDLDPVLETMVKKRILRFGFYGFGESKTEGYQKGVNYKVLYSSLESILKG